jgi:hypothetical protein
VVESKDHSILEKTNLILNQKMQMDAQSRSDQISADILIRKQELEELEAKLNQEKQAMVENQEKKKMEYNDQLRNLLQKENELHHQKSSSS